MEASARLLEELLRIERELADGPGDQYRRHLIDDAVVVVPGAVLTREQCADAIDQSPGWDESEIAEASVVLLTDDSAVLTYTWRSTRGETRYDAVMSTVYVRRDGGWKVALHQQTPQPG